MAEEQREREDKFDIETGFRVPDLAALAPGGRIEPATVALRSTYFDTEDHALLAQRVTLRRREGDTDTGWQLKVPDGSARTEIRLGLDAGGPAGAVPAELAGLTSGLSLGQPLQPVAVLDVERTAYRLYDEAGGLLAEVADDNVRAAVPGETATALQWRELEVELGASGSEELLTRAGKLLIAAGARRSDAPSKLGRALIAAAPATGVSEPRSRSSVGSVVSVFLTEQFRAISAGDLALRRGLDPIHPTRVATRRLRSTLRTFADLFDADAAGRLDGELAWYAALLGDVRDRQVQRARFADAVRALPPELVLGPVATEIDAVLQSEQRQYHGHLMAALAGDRYRALLVEVRRWASGAPYTPAAEGKSGRIADYVRTAERKSQRRLSDALAVTAPAQRAEVLHRARKAAKRARYAAELGTPVLGVKTGTAAVKLYKNAQDVLGEHHDSIVAADLLRRLGAAAGTSPGQNGFTYGILFAHQQRATELADQAAAELRLGHGTY